MNPFQKNNCKKLLKQAEEIQKLSSEKTAAKKVHKIPKRNLKT